MNNIVSNEKMKAAVYYKYGSPDVVSIAETEKPAPKAGEVLVQIKAASVNAYDWRLMRATPFFTRFLSGLFKPRNNILGADISGIVAAVGNGAMKFKPGDEVFGCLESCGKGGLASGGFAEYVCAKETVLATKSPMLSFEEAAGLPMAAVTALQGLRDDGQLEQGQSVLINGASGGVGLFAVQIAKALGAEVVAVCSTGSVELVRSLGADTVFDYTKEDFAKDGWKYDIILDVAATLSVKGYRLALKPNGKAVVVGFNTIGHMVSVSLAGKRDGKKIAILAANNRNADDLLELNNLAESGKLKTVIDSSYSLDETAKALHRAESGHPKGKVVIKP
ncbi:MAG: NAD(P)-dependent alcohol dehydrogenase [Clostridiales bacterium]|nr:NAD(P)-dependent alcohol dehydrogenase [Clostridiales bacterium]